MKTFKKLFSVSAIVALLGTLMPIYAFGANYTTELVQAYDYAHDHGITTMSSIDNADMYGNLTRIAMAKMLANYAIDVLGLTPDTTKECTFPDVTAALDAQYDNGVTKACQLGLMGVGIKNFNPNGIVTRAEFGTAFSRALNANDADKLAEMNKADPYYKDHLNFLKEEGIMNNISDPNMVEVRGYVMLMMMRSDDTYTPTEGCSAEELLKCLTADDYDACVAACTAEPEEIDEDEVKAGTLTVSMGDALTDGTQIPNAGIVSFGTVNFKASSDDINLKTVTIKKQGLVKSLPSTKVWFEENGVKVSAKASFNSDGEAIISFTPAYTIKANKAAKFDLYVDLTLAGLGGGVDLSFASTDVDSSAEKVNGSFNTPTLRTANYTVAKVSIVDQSTVITAWPATVTTGSVKSTATENGYQLAEFNIANEDANEDVLFKSITLRQNGSADLSNISKVVLERNGEVVSSSYSIDGKYITIALDNEVIEKSNNGIYTLRAKINKVDANDSYEFYLKNDEDLNIVEATTNFRTSFVSPTTATKGNRYLQGKTYAYTVEGGDVTFARDESLELDTTAPAGSQVMLLKGTITTKENVKFENPVLTLEVLTPNPATKLDDLFTTIYMEIGSSKYTYTATTIAQSATFTLDGTAIVNGKASVKVYGTLKNNATPGASIKLAALDLSSFTATYDNEENVKADSSIGTIEGNRVTIESTDLTVTRTDGLGTSATIPTGDGTTLYKANVTSQSTNGAKVTSIKFKVKNGLDKAYTLTLYVNGKAVSTRNMAAQTAATDVDVTFNGFNFTVDSKTTAEIEVKANIKEGTANITTTKLALNGGVGYISFVDLTNNKTVSNTTAQPDSANFEIVASNGTISIDTDAVDSKLLSKGDKDVELASIKVEATEGSVRLYNLALTTTNADNLGNVRLIDKDGNKVADATTLSATSIKFTELKDTALVNKDEVVTYKLVADVNSNVTDNDLTIALTTSTTDKAMKNSNGAIVNSAAAVTTNANGHRIQNSTVTVEQVTAANDLTSDMMRFTVSAKGGDAILQDLTLTINATNLSNAAKKDLVVYKGTLSKEVKQVYSNVTNGGAAFANGTSKITVNGVDYTYSSATKAFKDAGGNALGTVASDEKSASIEVSLFAEVTATSATLGAATYTNNVVTKGTESTFILAFPNATATNPANSIDWNISLKDLKFNVLASVKDYTNVAKLPFTAKK